VTGSAADERVDDLVRRTFAGPLLAWYRAHKRDLPWRRREDDAYAVWVSEIMLQQTQVATVIPYYERWMARFPALRDLADAPLDEVLRYWSGLGYYARARNLHQAARQLVANHGGAMPTDQKAIESLPGIGRYTAGAICSIAFNQPAPLVDANVMRVLTRVFAIDGDPKSASVQPRLWSLAEALIPEGEARDFNQAVMELGALVCTPSDPACERCPLLPVCRAGNSEDPTAWPRTPPARPTVRTTHCAALMCNGGRILAVRRPPHGRWGGLWELPRRVCESGESPADCAVRAAREVAGIFGEAGEKIATIKHNVTYYSITLHLFEVSARCLDAKPMDCAEARWVTLDELRQLPLSAPQKALADAIAERREHGKRQGVLF
jgi:A/G-specific adenine glycosylase